MGTLSLNPESILFYMGSWPVKGQSVPCIDGSVGSESVFTSQSIGNSMSSSCSWQPCADDGLRLVDNVVDEHRSSTQRDSHNGNVVVVFFGSTDDLLIKGFIVEIESWSLICRHIVVEE